MKSVIDRIPDYTWSGLDKLHCTHQNLYIPKYLFISLLLYMYNLFSYFLCCYIDTFSFVVLCHAVLVLLCPQNGIWGYLVFVLSVCPSVAQQTITLAKTFELYEIETSYLACILH